ncbi:hypothetical protein FS842_003933 [Serendipita sp. 407]|nr:hypothetical protein FS842_003933 [Serendipita sp. 407]
MEYPQLVVHSRFYFPSGDITLQIDNTLLKFYRHFITKESTKLEEIFNSPQVDGDETYGSDARPIILTGDSIEGWSIFLSLLYSDDPLGARTPHLTHREQIELLRIASKHDMNRINYGLLSRIKNSAHTTSGLVTLAVAADITDAPELKESAVEEMAKMEPLPTLEEAQLIGLEATYTVLMAVYDQMKRNETSLACNGRYFRLPNPVFCFVCAKKHH